jgi:hypothetical protein
MEEGSIAVLVDAKEEYTKQLISVLKPCIYQGLKSIYADAKDICNQDNTPDKVLMVFQDLLSRIPKWSQDIINKEFDRVVSVSKCDYLEDLLKVIYVSHIKVLTIVHSAQKNKKLSLKVPNGGHFIHLCYIESAREFWKDPYLFSENVNKYELQKNMRDSENMISECIAETIRKQLPVRHILKEFLNEPDEEIEEAEDDVREPVNKKYMKKLESVVKKELKTTTKDAGGIIDIDLIRKVIREELSSRPETNIIKKELVETVVEKIVEQASSEQNSESVSNTKSNNTEAGEVSSASQLINESSNIVEKDNIIIPVIVEPVIAKPVIVEPVIESTVVKTIMADKIDTLDEDSTNLEELLEEIPMTKPSTQSPQDIDKKDKKDKKTESTNTLERVVSAIKSPIKVSSDDIVVENKITEKDSICLKIDNIDEINLNLDELDDEHVNLSDAELEEFDINKIEKSNSNTISTKSDNTKHIFFKE